jgi:hypothetical protein
VPPISTPSRIAGEDATGGLPREDQTTKTGGICRLFAGLVHRAAKTCISKDLQ